MHTPHLPAAVLWDMDGTLVDTEPYWMAAETAVVSRHGGTWTTLQALELVGNDLITSAQIIRARTGIPGTDEEIVAEILAGVVARVAADGAPWRPGALELLAGLRAAGVPCALVTMSYQVLADAVVAAAPAGAFDAVVTGDQVSHGKPHPEAYLTAARRLGVDITRCVAIEDSSVGVAAALASGARTIAVPLMVPVAAQDSLSRLRSLADADLDLLGRVLGGEVVDALEPAPDTLRG
ncbi:HAD family phosphatase [Georgenia sp. SYP-B2076]|uniref:HAD family hydrolase n=1 Tax=Georgenia sp. SYP-B2076 TaxID=2495881 RepID=UPI001F0C3E3F|nr:HAD family phosphatase [Georgenia sp. SYP-B2076]